MAGLLPLRLLLDVEAEVVSGLEVEGDELDRVLLGRRGRRVLETLQTLQHLQSPPHHLQLRVVQPAIHGGGGGGSGGSWWFEWLETTDSPLTDC